MAARDFDAIIIGSGPGGSTAADILTAAGWSVVIFEKGRNHLIDTANPSVLAADFSNDEIKFLARHFLGPDPLLGPTPVRSTTCRPPWVEGAPTRTERCLASVRMTSACSRSGGPWKVQLWPTGR